MLSSESRLFLLILFILLVLFAVLLYFFITTCQIDNFQEEEKNEKNERKEANTNTNILDLKTKLKEIESVFFNNTTLEAHKKKYYDSVTINTLNKYYKKGTILVSVASYRDEQCIDTIRILAQNADLPENLHFVICQQNNSILDSDCLNWCANTQYKNHKACAKARKTIIRLKHTEARGPTWARFIIQQQYDGEEYFLQIDAHTRMIRSWDTLLKNQLQYCPDIDKAILTQLPCEYDIVSKTKRGQENDEKWRTDLLRGPLFVEKIDPKDHFFRIQSNYTENEIKRQPFVSTAWVAGFSFSKANFIFDVPYDPYLPFLFFGEETDITLRAFTHGYNFYSPTLSIVFHNYKREHRNTFWEHPDQHKGELLSRLRLYAKFQFFDPDDLEHLLPKKYRFILTNLHRWNLGTERTIEEYEKFANINVKPLIN